MLTETTVTTLKARGLITEKYIGKGAFGSVYTCRKNFGRKKYAAKVVEFGDDNKIKWQTENEIDILKEVCNHANIVGLHGVLRDSRNIVMVLEFIPGSGFLDGLLNWPHFEEGDAKKIVKQLLGALSFCHSKRIIHRDVCPDNILWYDVPTLKRPHATPTLKLIDFNLSRKIPEHLDHLRADALGNPSYMAPECLDDKPITNFATDVWSVGVLTFMVLGGYPPFFNNNYNHLLQNIMEGSYVMPQQLWSHVSNEGRDFITKILCVDHNSRPTVDQLLSDKWMKTVPSFQPNKRKSKVWDGQMRMKGFLYTLKKQRSNSTHRKFSLIFKERQPFIPDEKTTSLPPDVTEANFYQKTLDSIIEEVKKAGKESRDFDENNNSNVDGNNNNANEEDVEKKKQCFHW